MRTQCTNNEQQSCQPLNLETKETLPKTIILDTKVMIQQSPSSQRELTQYAKQHQQAIVQRSHFRPQTIYENSIISAQEVATVEWTLDMMGMI